MYVAGQLDDQAVLWVNGEAISLDTAAGTDYSEAIGMYYYGGNLFIVGNEQEASGALRSVYWTYDGTDDPVRGALTGENDTITSGLDGIEGTLYISGMDNFDYPAETSNAVYWIVSAGSTPQKETLETGFYYTKDIVLDDERIPKVVGYTMNASKEIRLWEDGESLSTDTYTGLDMAAMDIEVDENDILNIMGNLNDNIMLWKEQLVREDTDPFEKITIHSSDENETSSPMGESLAFDAEGNAVIAGEVWVSNRPVATCWVYDGDSTETINLGEGLAKDVQTDENGNTYIAGYTYDDKACYWTVDSQGTVTQKVLNTSKSKAYAILKQ